MFYPLKKLLMKAIIKKRQKTAFDYPAAEAYVLPADADETVNNSYYFSAHGLDGTSLYCRLGIRSSFREVWFLYKKGDCVYTHKTLIHKEDCPLTCERVEEGWRFSYRGALTDDAGKEHEASFLGTFVSREAPVDFFSHMPPVCTARAMAGERWSRAFFSEVQKNNQVHYEQFGRLTGVLSLDGEELGIDLPCVRDHSFGTRRWSYMNNHLWLMAVREDSQLNFSMVSYPAMSVLELGNFKPREGGMRYIESAEYDRAAITAQDVPERLALTLRLSDGGSIGVEVECRYATEYLFRDEGSYRLLEGIADLKIDGVSYRGILELGFNGDTGRIFNGKEIRKLRV